MTRRAKVKPPGRGGARAGAGRPATGRTVKPVQLHLSPFTVAAVDIHRDPLIMSRSQWVTAAIRAFIRHDHARDMSIDVAPASAVERCKCGATRPVDGGVAGQWSYSA